MEDPLAAAPPREGGAAAAPILRRLMAWDAEGNPLVTTEQLLTKPAIHELWMSAAAQPYVPDPHDPADAQYAGLTCVEVMARKQILRAARTGDAEAVMDRLIGRPKQSVESTKLILTYEDTLKEIARKEALKYDGPRAIEAEIVEDPLA